MAKYGPEIFTLKSGKQVTIRHCELTDVDAFLEFQPRIAAETTHTLQVVGQVFKKAKIEAAWQADLDSEQGLRISAFDHERMVAQLMFYPDRQPPHPWTSHVCAFGMFVLQEYWGEGIGRRLLEVMETHARFHKFRRIEAQVRTENDRGVRLYQRMGYEIEGTRKQAASIDGRYQNEYFIAKLLDRKVWVPPQLETERLILRPLILSDAKNIFKYASNPNVSRYTLWEPHQSIKDSESYVLDYAFKYYREGVPEPLGITLKSQPDQVIGTVGLFWVSQKANSMELAYAISESYWGQGVVAEASKAVCEYCFEHFDVVRIQARCKIENKASVRVMEKLGMKYEGTLRSAIYHRDQHWDMNCYAVIKSELEKAKNLKSAL